MGAAPGSTPGVSQRQRRSERRMGSGGKTFSMGTTGLATTAAPLKRDQRDTSSRPAGDTPSLSRAKRFAALQIAHFSAERGAVSGGATRRWSRERAHGGRRGGNTPEQGQARRATPTIGWGRRNRAIGKNRLGPFAGIRERICGCVPVSARRLAGVPPLPRRNDHVRCGIPNGFDTVASTSRPGARSPTSSEGHRQRRGALLTSLRWAAPPGKPRLTTSAKGAALTNPQRC